MFHTTMYLSLAAASFFVLALGLTAFVAQAPSAGAWTSMQYQWVIHYSGDAFRNYDNTEGQPWSTHVDWPVRYLFRENAEVDDIKDMLDGCSGNGGPTINPCLGDDGGAKSHYYDDASGVYEDKDSGIKQGLTCEYWDYHMRVYANDVNDWNYNDDWGYWVVATVHRDYEDPGVFTWECTGDYESTESDESFWSARIAAVDTWDMLHTYPTASFWMMNNENGQMDASHYLESNGWGIAVEWAN